MTSEDASTVQMTGALDETVRLWEVRSGQCIHTIPAHCDPVTAVDCCRCLSNSVSCSEKEARPQCQAYRPCSAGTVP